MVLTVKSCHARYANSSPTSAPTWPSSARARPGGSTSRAACTPLEVTRNKDTGALAPAPPRDMGRRLLPPQSLTVRLAPNHRIFRNRLDRCGRRHPRRRPGDYAKYIGKPQHLDELPPLAIREYATAVAGSRMIQTFGTLHGKKIRDEVPQKPMSPATFAVCLPRLVFLAGRGAREPLVLLPLIAEAWPMFCPYIYQAHPQLTPPLTAADRMRIIADIVSRPDRDRTRDPITRRTPDELQSALVSSFTRFRLTDEAGGYDKLQGRDPPSDT